MFDPDSPGYAVWYEAQLGLVRQCEEWRSEIRFLRAKRVLVDGTQRVTLMSHNKLQGYTTRTELVAMFADRGPQLRRWAKAAKRDELAERIIQDRLDTIDAEIARLEQLIADNQPSPFWRERKEIISDD